MMCAKPAEIIYKNDYICDFGADCKNLAPTFHNFLKKPLTSKFSFSMFIVITKTYMNYFPIDWKMMGTT